MWDKIFSNPYLSLLRTAWRYAGDERPRYVLVYVLFIISNILEAILPALWGWFINQVQKEGASVLRSAWIYAGIYLLVHFLVWAMHGPARIWERRLAFNLSRNFLQELYHKSLHLPVKWHQDHHSGATINRVRKAYEALKEFFENGFMYLYSFARLLFSFAAIIYFAPAYGTIAAVFGVLTIYVILRFDKPFLAALNETNEREHVVSSTLFDSLSNIITVITLRLQQRMESGLLAKVKDVFPPFRRKVIINEWKWFSVETCVSLIYAIVLLGFVYSNYRPGEVFLVGGLVTLIMYVERFTSVFGNIAWQYTEIVQHHANVVTAENIIQAYAKEHLPETRRDLPAHWKELRIRALNFSHEEAASADGQPARRNLDEVSISLRRGQKIAFIGESGSGKSTLLALLRGLYPPEPGVQVEVDGQSFNRLDVIPSYVTLFPQEPEIFENTLEYNITLGLPFTPEEVEAVCRTAHFSEVVQQLPKGLESNIMEKGVNLSGGQKQRLALARGVLAARDSDIVLLDEPTSSVDPKTEWMIYEKMFQEFRDKVVVSALHRLHLLRLFDYVYIMDKGRVVDEGTFAELRQRSPHFQELWRHQEEGVGSLEPG